MNFLKSLSVSILSFILFVAILAFGIVFAINGTLMNPDFINDRIDGFDTVEMIDEIIEIDGSPETMETIDSIKEIIPDIEPLIKERIAVAIDSFYEYVQGDRTDPELREVLRESFLNAAFIDSVLQEVSIPEIMDTALVSGTGEDAMPEEFIAAMKEVVADLEPELKEQSAEMFDPIFSYVLGETSTIDMTAVLRDTIMNEDFIVPIIDKLDLSAIAEEYMATQLENQVPPEMAFLTDHISGAIDALEPTIKAEFRQAAGPFLDYILGETDQLSIFVSLDKVGATLETALKQELLSNPPDAYAGLSQSELEQLYESNFAGQITAALPDTFEIDESIIGPDIVGNFAGSIADFEDALTEIRTNVDDSIDEVEFQLDKNYKFIEYFKLAYTILIVIIAVMVVGIILILRDVRKITRTLGVPLLLYGAIEYIGIWVGKFFLNGNLPVKDIPPGLEEWISDLAAAIIRPTEIFSLSLLIIGLILTIVSFVYKRNSEPEVTE